MSNSVKLGNTDIEIEGRFRLDVRRDPKKFSLTNINSFVPLGKRAQDRMRFLTEDSGETDTLFIDRISCLFDPRKEVDAHNIAVFIQHPDVMIGGMPEDEYQRLVEKKYKNDNPTFMITNVDKVEMKKYDEEVNMLKIRAKLYSDEQKLNTKKLIWLCSNFGIPYASDITDSKRYDNELRKRIDKYITTSIEHAEKVDKALNEMTKTEMQFYINELKSMDVITYFGGIYKIEDQPIGSSIEHLMQWYDSNQQIFLEHKKLVADKMKSQYKS